MIIRRIPQATNHDNVRGLALSHWQALSPGPIPLSHGGHRTVVGARRDHHEVCVFITAVSITKLFAWAEGDSGGHVLRETSEPRPVWTSLPITH